MTHTAVSMAARAFREKVQPKMGSLLYCEWQPDVGHTGVYVGNERIIHLNAAGKVEEVDIEGFVTTLASDVEDWELASILVSCQGKEAIGSLFAVAVAKDHLFQQQQRHWQLDTCHQFTSACYTGNFQNQDHCFGRLQDSTRFRLGWDNWRVWCV